MSKPIFDKVLIANRGEIACRVITTCRRLGIKTVAIYSNVDEQAKHVKMADEAVCVGTALSKDSYLRIDRIIEACRKLGVNAVHPGYGFLSENADFSAELARNNIIFIGPDAHSIQAMGDKIHSKKLAAEAKVNVIPGYLGEITNHKQLLEVANEIGYPVMVKASAGGGGKGMHIAYNDKECAEYFELCKAEAASAFGNDTMLVEKFIEHPRHIEIQVIADRKGNTLYLPERECSIQRRNQKVLEEAPSMLIDPKTRKEMGEQAAAMARKVDYVSAGTVEMVVNPKRHFYFLEMNTRLQVEHPISELITGIDLVEQMIRAAAGLELSVKQSDIKINGWATEARVYAEDPTKNYFPSIGRLTKYEEPVGDGVRVDSGILDGSQISVYYDPLIAKLCTWGPTRNESLARMRLALDDYVIRGLKHNVCLLRDVICQQKYIDGDITTAYLAEEYEGGFKKAGMSADQKRRLVATGAVIRAMRELNMASINKDAVHDTPVNKTFSVCLSKGEEKDTPVLVNLSGVIGEKNARLDVTLDRENACSMEVHWQVGFPVVRVTTCFDNERITEAFQFFGTNGITFDVQFLGTVFGLNVLSDAERAVFDHMPMPSTTQSAKTFFSPMPGVVVDVHVQPGDKIVAGAELLTLEAMKMRNKLRAEVDGVVKTVRVKTGQTVEDNAILVEFE
jgi:propionyl-CoA carboxylase alpha chain